jgi:hypothetical protein
MGGPFRTDEEVRRERAAELESELAEVEAKLFAARQTERGLKRRARPFLYTVLSPIAILWLVIGIGLGAALQLWGIDHLLELAFPTPPEPPSRGVF